MKYVLSFLFSVMISAVSAQITGVFHTEGVGAKLHHKSYHIFDEIKIEFPGVVSASYRLYLTDVVTDQTTQLIDIRGAYQTITLDDSYSAIIDGTESVLSENQYSGHYSIVIDVNENEQLDSQDFVDDLFILGDFSSLGPYSVASTEFTESYWHTFKVHYPVNIEELSQLPLIVVSHGWEHHYTFYDFLGEYMSSYGYVVMSHRNDVGNGTSVASEQASVTTLENTEVFLSNLSLVADGLLQGHIDMDNIVFTGHSTGGECVVRAYSKLYNNEFISPFFDESDITLVSSIAPVSFLSGELAHPQGVNYHQFLGAADSDCSGWADDSYGQSLRMYERGWGNKQVTYIHGAGHEDFHGFDSPNPYSSGPNLIGKEATHSVMKPYMLALCDLYCKGDEAMLEYFTRNRNEFRPLGISDIIFVSGEFVRVDSCSINLFDFQDVNSSAGLSIENCDVTEIVMSDIDQSFEFEGDPSNGMCRAAADDNPRCISIEYNQPSNICFDIPTSLSSENSLLSFRASRLTRHPLNSESDSTNFSIVLNGDLSVDISSYGCLMKPYPRSNGGYYQLCLEQGGYSVYVGGSQFDDELSFTIPGYFENQPAGVYSIYIPPGNPCTELEIFMYDSYGDGWDIGFMEIATPQGDVVFTGTLPGGAAADTGEGWQNEFYIYEIPIKDFGETEINVGDEFCFQFGTEGNTSSGAIAIDNISISTQASLTPLEIQHSYVESESFMICPNPASSYIQLSVPSGYVEYQIHNLTGELIIRSEIPYSRFIDTSFLQSGLYIVSVKSDVHKISQPLVIQH